MNRRKVKLVLGVVNEGYSGAGMPFVSLWTNYLALKAELRLNHEFSEIKIRVISKEKESEFCHFAKSVCPLTEIVEPLDWEATNFPPMSNGSFATYWKFDLLNSNQNDELLVYLDADAFVVRDFNLKSIYARAMDLGKTGAGGGLY